MRTAHIEYKDKYQASRDAIKGGGCKTDKIVVGKTALTSRGSTCFTSQPVGYRSSSWGV